MVFANLSSHEKDAFFSLLDELSGLTRSAIYFTSRPDLLASAGNGVSADAGRAVATSALQNAFSRTNPQDVASAVNASGFKRSVPSAPGAQPSNADIANSVGRVAAAAAAFGAPPSAAPRPPARRPTGSEEQLATQKKFGDIDISSGKAMFSSLRNSTANKSATPPPVAPPAPPAFARKSNFAPPPVRRMDSTASRVNKTPSPPPPPPPPARPRQEEVEGDWAEVIYDYSSDDPGDLEIQAGHRLLIVDRTSDDWWTGEMDSRRGLVPAAYVKLL